MQWGIWIRSAYGCIRLGFGSGGDCIGIYVRWMALRPYLTFPADTRLRGAPEFDPHVIRSMSWRADWVRPDGGRLREAESPRGRPPQRLEHLLFDSRLGVALGYCALTRKHPLRGCLLAYPAICAISEGTKLARALSDTRESVLNTAMFSRIQACGYGRAVEVHRR